MHFHSQHNRRGQAWLPVLAVVVIVGIGCAGGWWYFSGPSKPSPDQGQAIVEDFLKQLRQGKADQAWATTAADFKSYLGREAFRAFVGKHPVLKQPLQFQHHDQAENPPRPEYVYQTSAGAAKSASPRTVKVRLVQEAEQWKIESLGIQ